MSDVTVGDNPAELRDEALINGEQLGEIRDRTKPAVVALVTPKRRLRLKAPISARASLGMRRRSDQRGAGWGGAGAA
jgi:hypothetical protein